MEDKNSYLSRVTYKGGKDSYEFPFSYLRKDFVKAQIDVSDSESTTLANEGADSASNTLAYLVDYTIDGHTIKLTKPVDANKTITIYRETSSTPLVKYEDSSILRAYDLNLSQRQNLNILEEQTDIVVKNYSLSQDTKDYMYKNLSDTKTAIDNKVSETLATVANTKKYVEDSLATTTTNLNKALAETQTLMNSNIAQTSQALEEAKANLETTKSAMEKTLADTQSSLKDTESRVNETKADITKLADEVKKSYSSLQEDIKNISTTNRNTAYEVGDQIHSSYLPFNCYVTCVVAGTTGDKLPVIPKGDHDSGFTYTDGTATFKMDYWPLSINGQKPLNKAGDITINVNKVKEAEKADKATADGAGNNIVDTYVPKTGVGASGSWGINISGTASNADKLGGLHVSDIVNYIINYINTNHTGIVAAALNSYGYAKFANGLILQWGLVAGGTGFNTVNYPILFPNACFIVITSYLKNDRVSDYRAVSFVNNTGCGIGTDNCSAYWLAIGN